MHEVERPPDEKRALLSEEPTAELIKHLIFDAQALLKDELVLAKLSLYREAEKAKAASKALGVGAVLGFIALLLAAFTAVAGLATVLAPWLAGAIVTLIFGTGAAIALAIGRKTWSQLEPARAFDHVKEEAEWIKKTVHDIQSHKDENILH